MKNNRGSAAVMLIMAVSALIGLAVIAVDAGMIVYQKADLSNALDSAALAGAQSLPTDPVEAKAIASSYLTNNGINAAGASISVDADNKGLTVGASRTLDTIFGPLIGRQTVTITDESKVRIGPVGQVKRGIRPLVIEDQVLHYGDLVDLKLNATENYDGNFGAVALGGTGASNYQDNLIYGYTGSVKVGDIIYTEPGNMASVINPLRSHLSADYATFDNYSRSSLRLWVIPVVDDLEVSGSYPVTVVGFAEFFIEDIGRQSGQTKLQGRFVRFSGGGIADDTVPDYGLYGIKLVP